MTGFEIAKILMIKDLVENTVSMPWGTAANEFAIRSSQCIQNCVVEFLVVSDKVHFVTVNDVECWSSDGFGVVWECFYAASVCEVNLGSLGFESDARRQIVREGGYALEDSFGLAPRRTHDTNCALRMSCRVPEKKGCDDEGFAALPAPPGGCKLVVLKHLNKLFLVSVRFEAYDLFKKSLWVIAYFFCFLNYGLPGLEAVLLEVMPPAPDLVGA